ncbi:MAG: NAD(P)-dependent glycerol-3-phosphate dehydrogenase [Alphaproteobacteria bacterium]|nr:NAD(P)-dependent glycerol-3-phosphate dehydrogenase [Alphaproteobacteria bacterium]
MSRIAVVGGGAWGTALGHLAARKGHVVTLWAREPEVVEAVNRQHRNPLFLPEIALAPGLVASADMAALAGSEIALVAAPAQHLRAVCAALAPHWPAGRALVICAKGIEQGSHKLMTEIAAEILPGRPAAILSGPTFAAEVAAGLPTAVTLAIQDQALGQQLVETLGSALFRPYWSDDPIGAQIGGAVKNVIAIACGIVMGRGLGDNARAALIARGLAEMLRLARAKGGKAETLMGLSGLGDLVLTCCGKQSRNTSLGEALGRGQSLAAIQAGRRSVAEGVSTASAVMELARLHAVDMPIVAAMDGVLNRDLDIDAAVKGLLARPFKAEQA